ncbi:MAG: tRNA pseudouridine(55) synthase TruB [Candidatus Nanopelagicales bacterium]|nr:tRNA pseudouridine(55) synthase TruB [Candidatus Nanopelagicales bacterium]
MSPTDEHGLRSGLAIVDKPAGWTSHDVVGRLRRSLKLRRVGHAGTLDPMATGVLVCAFGRGTRLLGHLAKGDKDYSATIRLGWSTVTDDATGEPVSRADPAAVEEADEHRIRSAMSGLSGEIWQRPSSVSAIKVDGRRAYRRVRAGEEIELAARQVTVARFELGEIRRDQGVIDLDVSVTCGSGTYVRALARDLGEGLGLGGHLTALRRTRVGTFGLPLAVQPDEVDSSTGRGIVSMEDAARSVFPTWTVTGDQGRAVRSGFQVEWAGPNADDVVAIFDEAGSLLALARELEGRAAYAAVLAEPNG